LGSWGVGKLESWGVGELERGEVEKEGHRYQVTGGRRRWATSEK
jgi:hypothetical protein